MTNRDKGRHQRKKRDYVGKIPKLRAPLEPRASLIVHAPLAPGSLEDGRAGLSENAIFATFWP